MGILPTLSILAVVGLFIGVLLVTGNVVKYMAAYTLGKETSEHHG